MDTTRVAWAGGPDERGTMNILWSCFSTLALCVWTAVHPNIQIRSGRGRGFLARLGMMVTAVLFPEIIISSAMRQLELARRLRTQINKSHRRVSGPTNQPGGGPTGMKSPNSRIQDGGVPLGDEVVTGSKQTVSESSHGGELHEQEHPKWDNPQAFFVIMGGLAVDIALGKYKGSGTSRRFFLTPKGVEVLILAGAAPKITAEDVADRNNSDLFAKVIVVAQVTWFAVQVVARLVAGLPLSALELHTAVHAGCAVLMYAIWKDKPYDISRPILLDDPRTRRATALLVCKDALSIHQKRQSESFEKLQKDHYVRMAARGGKGHDDPNYERPPQKPKRYRLGDVLRAYANLGDDEYSPLKFDARPNTNYYYRSDEREDRIMAMMSADALSTYEIIARNHPEACEALETGDWSGLRQTSENFILRQVWGSWTTDVGHKLNGIQLTHYVFNLVYGGVHLAAWNSSAFPTAAEKTLWRVSSLIIALTFVWGMIWNGYWALGRQVRMIREGSLDVVFAPLFGWAVLLFAMARGYLLVESLISLRNSPGSMYQQVQWTSFLPHMN